MNFLLPDRRSPGATEDHWVPLTDLMTGLMMIFMLIAVVFMVRVEADKEELRIAKAVVESQATRMRSVAAVYEAMRQDLYLELEREFAADREKWKAEIDRDLTIRFTAPDVQFETNRSELKTYFKHILDEFFPRYMKILIGPRFKNAIEEIRIEGHTSTRWNDRTPEDDAYLLNMTLSQDRTRAVLAYVLRQPRAVADARWLKSHLTANGLSSSRLRISNGVEDRDASQRVEFRVRTNAETKLEEILREASR